MNDLMFEFLNDTTDAPHEEKIIIFEFDDDDRRMEAASPIMRGQSPTIFGLASLQMIVEE